MAKTLNKSKINSLQNHIEIFQTKIYDKHKMMDSARVQSVIESFKGYDIVHVMSRSMLEESKAPVVVSIQSVQNKCVLLSPCVSTKSPPAPVDFPCQMSIAVGLEQPQNENKQEEKAKQEKHRLSFLKKIRPKVTEEESNGEDIELSPLIPPSENRVEWQSCGSALDFVCHHQYGEINITNPWEASYFVTAITALILVKAYALGL